MRHVRIVRLQRDPDVSRLRLLFLFTRILSVSITLGFGDMITSAGIVSTFRCCDDFNSSGISSSGRRCESSAEPLNQVNPYRQAR